MKPSKSPILEFLFPSNACCLGCGDSVGLDNDWLCAECEGLLVRMDITKSAEGEKWPADGIGLARGVYRYSRPVIGIIHALKYDGVYSVCDKITEEMSLSLLDWEDIKTDFLVPVPMHISRERKRGYNQTNVITRSLSEKTGIPISDALKRTVNTKQQARSTQAQRHKNMLGAFCLMNDVKGLNLLLVDDVLTSGATANACASVLRGAGAKSVNLITIATASH